MNLLSFPFYDNLNKQSRFGGCEASVSALFAPKNKLLPFFIRMDKTGERLQNIQIYTVDNILYQTIPLSDFQYDFYQDANNDLIFYYGTTIANLNLQCGILYYAKVRNYFSEIFEPVDNIGNYLKLEWYHEKGKVEDIIYQTGFRNALYLNTGTSEPLHVTEEEGEEDGRGVFVPGISRLDKTYNFSTTYLPLFILDALAGVFLHNRVFVGSYSNVREWKIETKGRWNTTGCVASPIINFLADIPASSDCCSGEFEITQIDLEWNTTGNTRCEQINGINTGFVEIEEVNNDSGTTRWVRGQEDLTRCPAPARVYRSAEIRGFVSKIDCPAGQTTTQIEYIVEEGHVIDTTSQTNVDQRAQVYYDITYQTYANDNGICEEITAQLYCAFDNMGCFTGQMIDNMGNTYNPTSEQCEGCRQQNGGNCFDVACI